MKSLIPNSSPKKGEPGQQSAIDYASKKKKRQGDTQKDCFTAFAMTFFRVPSLREGTTKPVRLTSHCPDGQSLAQHFPSLRG
jgi:hypothetical protein